MKDNKTNKSLGNKIIRIIPKKEVHSIGMVTSSQFVKNFLSKFTAVLTNVLYIEPKSKILVAVSGGVDSVSLLDAFALVRTQLSLDIAIAHLNHMLRGEEANRDEDFVQTLAENYGIPLLLQRFDIKTYARKHSLSIEDAGRKLRYDFLKRAGQSFSANYIATAHNLNDQAETVLFNIIRGTGLAGLRGIGNKFEVQKNLFLIRPFLSFTRQEIEQYARERGLQWIEDSSNYLLHYTRNKIRHKLIPMLEQEFNPQVVHNLGKLSTIAQNSYKIVNDFIKKLAEKVIVARNKNEIEFDIESFKLYDDSLFPELIQFVFINYLQITLTFKQIEDIRNLVDAESGKFLVFPNDIIVYKNRRKLLIIRKDKFKSDKLVIRLRKIGHTIWKNFFIEFEEIAKSDFVPTNDPNVEFFDFDKIGNEIVIRSWEEGDRFIPLGMKNAKKLSDFFIDEKVPLYKKEDVPIFVTNGEIFWVGGIRISERFKVTKRTEKILRGKITEIKEDGNISSFF
ncbi:tRNA lysidine(34) synthetase TilS [Bacteroidetes/Chlorobi group bacterium Naka2016]|nr:MAG: tRNA lysidine(34) synthetase TilS [Bacteroidetes/Chlorobi group bacterium Naka2016]